MQLLVLVLLSVLVLAILLVFLSWLYFAWVAFLCAVSVGRIIPNRDRERLYSKTKTTGCMQYERSRGRAMTEKVANISGLHPVSLFWISFVSAVALAKGWNRWSGNSYAK
jgi:hypothetical protein